MRSVARPFQATVVIALTLASALAQTPPTTPAANAVAATVNGQPILEASLQRGLEKVPKDKHGEVRPEMLNNLIDNLLIDQYLVQLNVAVDKKEVEGVLEECRVEAKNLKKSFEEMLQYLKLTEEELRYHIAADLRWRKFLDQQATDKVLTDLFTTSKEMFDGSMVRARHIMLAPPSGDAQAGEQAKAQLVQLKKQIEEQVTAGVAKLPAGTDKLGIEQARIKLLDDTFAALAREKSACPSSKKGGDVDWFPRVSGMVEPFAKAAFALQPYQMSDIVKTQYGYHLILLTERKPGKDTKFADVREEVKEVFSVQLRDALTTRLRETAKIVVNPAPKP